MRDNFVLHLTCQPQQRSNFKDSTTFKKTQTIHFGFFCCCCCCWWWSGWIEKLTNLKLMLTFEKFIFYLTKNTTTFCNTINFKKVSKKQIAMLKFLDRKVTEIFHSESSTTLNKKSLLFVFFMGTKLCRTPKQVV